MQQDAEQLQEEMLDVKEQLAAAEAERDRARQQLKEVKKTADEANIRLNEAMANGKVGDVFTELNSAMDSLSRSNQELKLKDMAISSLKAELAKAKELEAKLAEKDALLDKLKEELSNVKSSQEHNTELLLESKKRIEELEAELEKRKELEKEMLDSSSTQAKKMKDINALLEESRLEATVLRDKLEKLEVSSGMDSGASTSTLAEELESLKSEIELLKSKQNRSQEGKNESNLKDNSLLEEMDMIKKELKEATKAEEYSKKAMDDLALALKEVATEANQAREKLIITEEELDKYKKESEELNEKVNNMEENHRTALEEARRDVDLYRNTSERLRLEAEESLLAWNGKETGFVECIKRAEDEKEAALVENNKLLQMLTEAENLSKTAKQESQNLRDILKQALNEASVAKEAAGIAQAENSQLKDILAEKDDALMFITRENENLRINEAAAQENIKDLKRLLSEASGKEFTADEKEHEHKTKQQSHSDKEHSRKPSSGFSFNLKELITHSKHKEPEEDHKIPEKLSENDEFEDSETGELFRGSIFDVAESPVVQQQHHRKKSFADELESINSEDLHNLDGAHMDELEHERNSRKKKALLRRVGDIIMLRRGVHRREPSLGGEGHKKEPSSGGCDGQKKDPSTVAGADQGHKKEPSIDE